MPNVIGYEIDHAGPRDFRVQAILENGARDWRQTYPTRAQAERGLRACEKSNPPNRDTQVARLMREARRKTGGALARIESASLDLIVASPLPSVVAAHDKAESALKALYLELCIATGKEY